MTNVAIWLGPRNPLVLAILSRQCHPFGVSLISQNGHLELRRKLEAIRIAPKHFVYVPHIAGLFDTYFRPIRSKKLGAIATVDYSVPGMQTYVSSGLSFEMPAFPEEEEAIEAYFRYFVPASGDLVFDIGAHCGISTQRLSTLVGATGTVIAFEPDPITFPFLLRNIELHRMTNVIPVKAAISGHRGLAKFSSEGAIGSGLAEFSSRGTTGKTEMVEALTLVDAFTRFGVPSFCKIDIEGAEIAVLASAMNAIREHTIHFALDTNHRVGALHTTFSAVDDIFSRCGYAAKCGDVTWAAPRPATQT